MNEVRMKNKEAGRLCGNCRYAYQTTDSNRVCCTHPVKNGHFGEVNWFRKHIGGCKRWGPKEDKP